IMYDPVRGRCLLAGVVSQPFTAIETWEYDGATWSQSGSAFSVYTSYAFVRTTQMAFDSRRQRMLLLDGVQMREVAGPEADATAFGQGCGNTVPLLAATTRPRTGSAAFGLEAMARPALPVVFALGIGQGSTPLGSGCTLLVQQVLASAFVLA